MDRPLSPFSKELGSDYIQVGALANWLTKLGPIGITKCHIGSGRSFLR